MVVITIISVLSAVAVGAFNENRKGARDAKRIQELKTIATVLELELLERGGTFDCAKGIKIEVGYASTAAIPNCADQLLIESIISANFSTTPHDPSGPGNADYFYYVDNHTCGTQPDGVFLFTNMEVEGNSNRDLVCDPDNGVGGSTTWDLGTNNQGYYLRKGAEERFPYVIRLSSS